MPAGKLSYKDWLAKSGRRSSDVEARAWAKWAGKPAPKGRGAPGAPANRRRGPGVKTPPYMGYAGYQDPSFGGTPFSLPADSQQVWTGAGNPDLAEISRGGFGNLTPRKRPGGGWDVYGTPTDPTPQWGKDYLSDLNRMKQGHMEYAEKTISPWLGQVLGAANNTNAQAQTGLANLMASVNTNMANAAQGGGQTPTGMTGVGAAPGAHQAIAQQQALQTQAGANIFGGAYRGALGQAQIGGAAEAQEAAFAQSRLKLPTQYEKMRMDFTKQLGEITEGIKENQRAREFQRQQLLEQRREFGLEFKEKVRSTKAQERAEAEALGFEVAQSAAEEAATAQEAENQTYADIKSSIDPGSEELVDNKGRGWANRPNINRYHGKPVTWQQATNGKWYGIAGKEAGTGGGGGGGAANKDYMKRWREYSGSLSDKLYGPVVKLPADEGGGSRRDKGQAMSWTEVIDDVFNVQRFRPEEAWSMLRTHIKRLGPSRNRIESTVVKRMAQQMKGKSKKQVLDRMETITGMSRGELSGILGIRFNRYDRGRPL